MCYIRLIMKTALNNYKKILFCVLFIISNYGAGAQALHRVFTFQTGDEYKKQIRLNSTCVIQRGKQKLDVNSSTEVSKLYKVTSVSDTAYEFTVSIQKLDNRINSLGKELHYNSENAMDTTSQIHKVLKYMMRTPSLVSVNKNGIILSAIDPNAALASDTLFAFAGLPDESYHKGTQFGITADFSKSKSLKKGYKWTASSRANNQQMTTDFVIDDMTDAITVIKFKSSIKGQYLNSNTNGAYILDNKSGIIIQKLVESISTGYQLKNKIVYATTRKISLSEDCVKTTAATAQRRQ
jgi:hypothetical protein